MNVLIIGNPQQAERFDKRFPGHHLLSRNKHNEAPAETGLMVWFDGPGSDHPLPESLPSCPLMIESTYRSLQELLGTTDHSYPAIGFTALSTFFEREIFEVSLHREAMRPEAEDLMAQLETRIEWVKDQAGLVTPRVIGMILNEAFITVEEGTAGREDIDIAMKLGTGYPFGPFEWSENIGLPYLYRYLQSVYESSGDIRYKPSGLLYEEALRST